LYGPGDNVRLVEKRIHNRSGRGFPEFFAGNRIALFPILQRLKECGLGNRIPADPRKRSF